ncbi:Rz1-like lysis system protein LysC [Stenotrophomonas maltophilia]|uniref:Rz1-like lysis system protein LysC n=1 Tax=Stenotrophomonas maltophilia TaxID=40324 RepID=UPI001E45AC7E|nr:hypothetical protein [Stenotrophomonas maltophilia]
MRRHTTALILLARMWLAARGVRPDCWFQILNGWEIRRWPMSLALVAVIPLCGFGSCSKAEKPDLPKVVYVPVERTVAVPAALTSRCPAKRASSRTVEAVVAAYNANLLTLEDCDSRMSEIRQLGKSASEVGP